MQDDNKIFTFRNGRQLWARDDYNPHLRDLAVEGWREQNLPPEPPVKIKSVPVKGGTKEIEQKDWGDTAFQALYSIWMGDLRRYQEDIALYLAVDRGKIDRDLVDKARAWAEQSNIKLPADDVQLYIHLVADPVKRDPQGKPAAPGDKKAKSDFDRVAAWLDSLGGPSEALIEQFLGFNLQNGSDAPGDNDGHLGLSNDGEPKPVARGSQTARPAIKVVNLPDGSK